jgi:inositol transport system substrate-binding protein
MKKLPVLLMAGVMALAAVSVYAGGGASKGGAGAAKKIAFCFQDLETEFWVAGYNAITETLKAKGIDVIQYNANEDANRQLEQVNDAIAQKVDGIIIIPQDGESAVTICKTANLAGVPIAVFNRPPSNRDAAALVVVADNKNIAYEAGKHMVQEAKKRCQATGKKIIIGHMIGDLGDPNAIARKQGFEQAVAEAPEVFEKTVEIPTKWDANTALANLRSAMQAEPNIGLIFCGSDFLYPQIKSVLEPLGKWQKIGNPNHVILGAVDGDAGAGALMDEGYVDATAVQDLYFEAEACMNAILEAIEKGEKRPNKWIDDPGFALTQANMAQRHDDMWGNKLRAGK